MTNLLPKNKGKDSPYILNRVYSSSKISSNDLKEINVCSQKYTANRIQTLQTNTKNRLLTAQLVKNDKQPNIIVIQHEYPQHKMLYHRQAEIEAKPKSRFFEKGLSKVLYLRLVRNLSQLKSDNLQLIDVVKKQERCFKQQKERWQVQLVALSLQLEEMESLRQINNQNKLNDLKEAVKLRDQLISELNKMISNLKSQPVTQKTDQQHHTFQTCANCQLLEIKLNSVKEEAMNMAKKQARLKEEYQILQQKVFDLEQEVVGIDLEVERRLKEALQSLPQLSSYNHANQQIIDSMNKQNQTLRVKCQKLEKYLRDQQILRTKEEQLKIMEKEYQLKNQALLQAIARNQNVIQLSYEREHHLLLAEQNLSKKIEQLRIKETQLSQWENHLTKNQNSIKNNYLQQPSRQTFGNNKMPRQEDQSSLKSFGNQPQDYEFTHSNHYNFEPVNNIVENIQGQVYIPILPLNDREQYNEHEANEPFSANKVKYTFDHRKTKKIFSINNQKSITESAYAYRTPYLIEKSKNSASNHNLHIKSPVQRQKHYVQPSIQGSRIVSIGNISMSRQSQSPLIKNLKIATNNPKYSGIESKLDRLRIELRKQIESIK